MSTGDNDHDPLSAGFQNPPHTARPHVWWHWINGYVSEEGIKRDLQWMYRIGVGGVHVFEACIRTPVVDSPRHIFMTGSWEEKIRYAVTLAKDLGLQFGIAAAPGWSQSGAPWVTPRQGMKKLVWSETLVKSEGSVNIKLPRPSEVIGPFQNARKTWDTPLLGFPPVDGVAGIYTDVAVVAYRLGAGEEFIEEWKPTVTSSAGDIDGNILWDGDYDTPVVLPFAGRGQCTWLQLDFGEPRTVQSMSLALQGKGEIAVLLDPSRVCAVLQCSSDGAEFRAVAVAYDTIDTQQTIAFSPTTARYFRLLLPDPETADLPDAVVSYVGPPQREHLISEFRLYAKPRMDRFEQKAGYFVDVDSRGAATHENDSAEAIEASDVWDLTSLMGDDGSLKGVLPNGRWGILRIGWSLLGTTNRPAPLEATGLEVDKLDRAAVRAYIESYLTRIESIVGTKLSDGFVSAMVSDSWEVGAQNWTETLPAEFARRRGYELRPWMPALTGRIIKSARTTERFLWDYRRTLGELVTESHYQQIAETLHAHGMLHYCESHESGRAFIGDGMDAKRAADVPMGAMWIGSFFPQEKYDADLRESASVAHIYGKTLVAVEAMTAVGVSGVAHALSPEDLKSAADRAMVAGANRFVLHTSVHQPLLDQGPGITLGPFGHWFTRNETWAEKADVWLNYLARSCYLLQQGTFFADIIYYYGEDSNITALYGKSLPPIPDGYAFDFVNASALKLLSVSNGELLAVGGGRYRVLALDPRASVMSFDALKEIARLTDDGGTVIGEKPVATFSLADDETQFQALADAVWGRGEPGIHRHGRGRVLCGRSMAEGMKDLEIPLDFSYTKSVGETKIGFVHRQISRGHIYFVSNLRGSFERIEARFRVRGLAPEMWHADTGIMEPAAFRQDDDHTVVPLELSPYEAVFVMFRCPTQARERSSSKRVRKKMETIPGPWEVSFQRERGAPERAVFSDLMSWTESEDPRIKYFSGTADYERAVNVPKSWLVNGRRVELDLGKVKNVAEVFVNGSRVGVIWKWPFRVEVTDQLRVGENIIRVGVTNLWANRLIGDRQPGANPIAFTTFNPYRPGSELLESGLLGPVTIVQIVDGVERD